MRARFLLSEVRIGLRRNLTMTFAVVVTTAISLSLLGIGLLSNAQVGAMKDYWYDKIEVSVFLCGNLSDSPSCANGVVTAGQRLTIQQDLQEMSVVDSVFYESQSEAFTRFQERFKDSAIAQNVTADQLPESFRVKLKDPTQFSVIVSAFSGRPGVDVVQDQRTILEKFFKLLGVLRNGALVVGLMNFSIALAPYRSAGEDSVPRSAVAAATSGLTKCVRPPLPWRPSKLRFDVDAERSPTAS
jgi:cell division transport system permease protein